MKAPSLESLIADKRQAPSEWVRPQGFDLSNNIDRDEVKRRLEDGEILKTIDPIEATANDLFEMRYPAKVDDESERQAFVSDMVGGGNTYGQWFHFPWDNSLVRYPEYGDFEDLRTFRNKEIVTEAEQRRLLETKPAVFGLSVGRSVVEELTQSGIGRELIMGDADILMPTNLNRIRSSMARVGMYKLDDAAQKVSEIDPYMEQIHFRDGIDSRSIEQLFELKPDVIFDEVDNLSAKALLRVYAKQHKVPVIMATDVGDTSLIDVERYDTDESTKFFNGYIPEATVEALAQNRVDDATAKKLRTKLVGIRNASPRLISSAMNVGETLAGLPQLRTTVSIGGALGTLAARELLIGKPLASKRYAHRGRKTLQLQSQTSLSESIQIVHKFLKS